MGSFTRISSSSIKAPSENHQIDAVEGLPSPFQGLDLEFTREELKQTGYEIFALACRAAFGTSGSNFVKTKNGLNFVPQTTQKTLKSHAASSIKKALGLPSKKSSENDKEKEKEKEKTPSDIFRMQMGISDHTDTRTRRALSRTAAAQAGKNVAMVLLPLELLQQIRLADFGDMREYQLWQKRQLKALELGLLLHPYVSLAQFDTAAQQRLRKILHSGYEKPLETGKNSESMQALRSAAMSLASRSDGGDDGKMQDVCHWADGFPFNLHIYQTMLSSCFDKADETNLIDEVDDVVDVLKKTWEILGITQASHNVCFMWVLFRQFVATGQTEADLLKATETQMGEVANDAKEIKDPRYLQVLRSVLTSIQSWSENRLFAYHDTFPNGAKGVMENLLPVALNAAKILHEDIAHEFRRRRKEEIDVSSSRIELYVRSSLKTAFAQAMEQADSRRKSMNRKGPVPGLVSLAIGATALIRSEREKFSPVLNRWHPLAASLAAATLHSCFSRELKQYLSGISIFAAELTEVLQSADQLEQELVQVAVEGAVDSDDGGKGIIREMVPFEAQTTIMDLSKSWMQEKLNHLREWIERNVNREDWNPQALREHYGASIVEVFRLIEETLDSFFALPMADPSLLLPDLVLGLDRALLRYVIVTKSGCGSKKDIVPQFPPLTRCKESKLHSSFSGLWKKKEKSPIPNRSKGQTNGGRSIGSLSSKICVRINTLYHIQTQIEALGTRITNGWLTGSAPAKTIKKGNKTQAKPQSQQNGTHLRFEQTHKAIQEGIPLLCEIVVYHVVFQDLRSEFWEGLYYGSVAEARIGPVIQSLESQLVFMSETVHEKLTTRLISSLMKVSFEALLMVMLAGGPGRAFYINDAEMLDEDFIALKDLFKADGDGIPSDTVEDSARVVTQVLPLFSLGTFDLIQNFRQCLLKTQSQNSKSRMPLPETTGQWGPTDANTLLRILCHRCDPAASKFLKKTYGLPKSS